MSLSQQDVKQALSGIIQDKDISGVSITDEKVVLIMVVDPAQGGEMEPLRQRVHNAIEKVAQERQVTVVMTAEKTAPSPFKVKGAEQLKQKQVRHKTSDRPVAPDVKYIIAVASGKGGVGKSTVSSNLAAALSAQGLDVGLLDADIYGASQPRMMGERGKPYLDRHEMIMPMDAHGMKLMSMGFFVEAEKPVVWRGPMVHSAIQQLLRDVAWGDLDVLVIDLPPGTGDAQLSLAQNVPLAGAVIVSTPQEVALSEAKKGMAMFTQMEVPILGLIENMSGWLCSSCGTHEDIFGHGSVEPAAKAAKVPFLGAIPLHKDIRIASDDGTPLVTAQADHAISKIYLDIAKDVIKRLEIGNKKGLIGKLKALVS